MEMSPNKTFNDYIFKDILNTIGPAVMGVKKKTQSFPVKINLHNTMV